MWSQIGAWYLDPRFIEIPITTLALSLGAFLAFATPWTLLAYFDPVWAQPYRIQNKPFDVSRYLRRNLWLITRNALIMLAVLVLIWPLLRLSEIHDGILPEWYVIASQLVFFILLDDYLYYWLHRSMHSQKWLLKHVHAVHHEIRNPCALAGNYFHWLEYLLTGALALVGPILVGCHIVVLYVWIIIRQLEAADGHAGYDFPWNPLRYLPVYDGPVYHDFHHARFKGNYAGFLHYVDRFYGTYIKEYLSYRYKRWISRPSDPSAH